MSPISLEMLGELLAECGVPTSPLFMCDSLADDSEEDYCIRCGSTRALGHLPGCAQPFLERPIDLVTMTLPA